MDWSARVLVLAFLKQWQSNLGFPPWCLLLAEPLAPSSLELSPPPPPLLFLKAQGYFFEILFLLLQKGRSTLQPDNNSALAVLWSRHLRGLDEPGPGLLKRMAATPQGLVD